MSYATEKQDSDDLKAFLEEMDEKLALINSAIDALVAVAEGRLGSPETASALRYLNFKRSEVERQYAEAI
jgi:hypothetical protein